MTLFPRTDYRQQGRRHEALTGGGGIPASPNHPPRNLAHQCDLTDTPISFSENTHL